MLPQRLLCLRQYKVSTSKLSATNWGESVFAFILMLISSFVVPPGNTFMLFPFLAADPPSSCNNSKRQESLRLHWPCRSITLLVPWLLNGAWLAEQEHSPSDGISVPGSLAGFQRGWVSCDWMRFGLLQPALCYKHIAVPNSCLDIHQAVGFQPSIFGLHIFRLAWFGQAKYYPSFGILDTFPEH